MSTVEIEDVISNMRLKTQKKFLTDQTKKTLLKFCSQNNWQDAAIRAADAYFVEIREQKPTDNIPEKIGYGLIALAGQDPHYNDAWKRYCVWGKNNPPHKTKPFEAAVMAAGSIASSIRNLPEELRSKLPESNNSNTVKSANTPNTKTENKLPEKILSPQGEIVYPDELDKSEALFEGIKKSVFVNRYERNPKARTQCIERYGVQCQACGTDFEKGYGSIGKGFIHVHHSTKLSDIGQGYEVDPIKDLQPVCPNCHAMLHKKNPPFTIEELKALMKAQTDATIEYLHANH